MTLRAVTPAPLVDQLLLYTADGFARPFVFRCALLQAVRGDTIGFLRGDELIAVASLYPCAPERPGEILLDLAFMCRPDVSQDLVALIHTARLTRARLRDAGAVRVRAQVRVGHEPGRRLARLCGLKLVGAEAGFEDYEWSAAWLA